MVFDKTGTLTQGTFKVTGVHPTEGTSQDALVEAAALTESWSKHPISLSVKAAYGKEIDQSRVTDVEELGGYGVTCQGGRQSRGAAGNCPPDGKAEPRPSLTVTERRHHRPCGH